MRGYTQRVWRVLTREKFKTRLPTSWQADRVIWLPCKKDEEEKRKCVSARVNLSPCKQVLSSDLNLTTHAQGALTSV